MLTISRPQQHRHFGIYKIIQLLTLDFELSGFGLLKWTFVPKFEVS